MYIFGDTIVALSTPPGRGAIAVVRLSGPESIRLVGGCILPKGRLEQLRPGRQLLAELLDPADGTMVDEAVVSIRKAPRSYTGEDMAELSLHGGRAVAARVLTMLIGGGARPAAAGEFTLRAFLNGKIDLARAEAVAELIAADSRAGAEFAAKALAGAVSKETNRLKDALVDLLSDAEAAVEFPEDGTPDLPPEDAVPRVAALADETARLAATYREGKLISQGASVVIAGRPNAGKSSLYNRLVGEERAIVTDIPGTTRDVLESTLEWKGMLIKLFDTAGLRETGDKVEMIGNELAAEKVESADAVIYVVDGCVGFLERDLDTVGRLKGKVVVALNKEDLQGRNSGEDLTLPPPGVGVKRCSALTGSGISGLKASVLDLLDSENALSHEGAVVTNARHHSLLLEAEKAMRSAVADLKDGATIDLVLECLERALSSLGAITGKDVSSEVLDTVFSKFCVGK